MNLYAKPVLESVTKYWSVILATLIAISWFGGFIVQVEAIRTEQLELRTKIVGIEQRHDKIDDKLNTLNVDVLQRLSRIEALLEEARKK